MRVLVVGASGTIGKAVVAELRERHEIVAAGREPGDIRVDNTDAASIRAAFKAAGPLHAEVSSSPSYFPPLPIGSDAINHHL